MQHARHAYCFLKEHCVDRINGGIYWSLTYDGKPEDTTKHTYNQAFAIYALASYYDASKDEEALKTGAGTSRYYRRKNVKMNMDIWKRSISALCRRTMKSFLRMVSLRRKQ